jgi:hypothetical protein
MPGEGPLTACRLLACALPASCPTTTFYDELPLHEHGITLPTLVPVCAPADSCILLTDSCPAGHVCSVVGDGVTTCRPPGNAARGQACSDDLRCAAGLVCAKTTGRCMRLCHAGSNECGNGVCQAGSKALQSGIGVCIDDDLDASQ